MAKSKDQMFFRNFETRLVAQAVKDDHDDEMPPMPAEGARLGAVGRAGSKPPGPL